MAKRRKVRSAAVLDTFSPLKITSQIASIQAIYYLAAVILILFSTQVAGTPFSLDLVFSWRSLRGDNTVGWMLGLVWMLNCLVAVIAITILVGRTKFVLDFTLTLHFLHLVVTTFYTHAIPSSWLWWALQLSSSIMMLSLATWTCQWKEMRPIAWKGGASGGGVTGGSSNNTNTINTAREVGQNYEMQLLKDNIV